MEPASGTTANRIAKGLGWFSIGLGVTELIAPGAIGRVTGTRKKTVIRAYGVREIAAGIGILAARDRGRWLWSRVAGDVMDLAAIGRAAQSSNRHRGSNAFGAAAVAGVTALDVWCARKLTADANGSGASAMDTVAEASMVVNRSPEECYAFWRDFENFPSFMDYLESVTTTGDRTSHWVARAPGGMRMEWDAEIVSELRNERLVWQSLPGADVPQTGSVEFEEAPGGRGTIVRVSMSYQHPAGALGKAAVLIGKDPEQMIRKELRRFKQAIETGEVIRTEGQPSGRRSSVTWLDSIAR